MTTIVYKKSYSAPEIDRREALRYAGVRGESAEAEAMLDECIREASDTLCYKLCYAEYPLTRVKNSLDFGFGKVESEKLASHLSGCDRVIVLAATVGIGLDRLAARYARISPAKALILQGLGAERIEAVADLLCRELADSGLALTSRFSAGYGDLSLEFQRDVFRALDCQKSIGLTLNESLIMSPTKSITAIIGIKEK